MKKLKALTKFQIAGIALVIASLAYGVTYAYCQTKVNEFYPWGLWICAGRLDEIPTSYREVPEDVDKWTLKALKNPGEWVYVEGADNDCWARGSIGTPAKYKGEYYTFGILYRDGPAIYVDTPEQKVVDYSPVGVTTLGILWAVLSIVWIKVGRTKNVAG